MKPSLPDRIGWYTRRPSERELLLAYARELEAYAAELQRLADEVRRRA